MLAQSMGQAGLQGRGLGRLPWLAPLLQAGTTYSRAGVEAMHTPKLPAMQELLQWCA